jgi:hypothetical protein
MTTTRDDARKLAKWLRDAGIPRVKIVREHVYDEGDTIVPNWRVFINDPLSGFRPVDSMEDWLERVQRDLWKTDPALRSYARGVRKARLSRALFSGTALAVLIAILALVRRATIAN